MLKLASITQVACKRQCKEQEQEKGVVKHSPDMVHYQKLIQVPHPAPFLLQGDLPSPFFLRKKSSLLPAFLAGDLVYHEVQAGHPALLQDRDCH